MVASGAPMYFIDESNRLMKLHTLTLADAEPEGLRFEARLAIVGDAIKD